MIDQSFARPGTDQSFARVGAALRSWRWTILVYLGVLALQRRRWLLAGILAGLATAVQPDAIALVVVCAVCAFAELHRRGWHDREARRSLLAPLLSVAGIGAFAIFPWAWTGTPFATLETQHYGWGEKVDPFALPEQSKLLAHELSHASLAHLHINLGPVAALLGAVVLLLRQPRVVSLEAMTLTLCIAFLAVVSENVPPNPRILITAFPVVVVFAHRSSDAAMHGCWARPPCFSS